MTTKLCNKCNTTKEITEFQKDKSKKDGFYPSCKECRKKSLDNPLTKQKKKEYMKKYWQENKEKLIEQNKQYRNENLDKCLETCRNYYKNNKEKCLENKQEYYLKNKETIKQYRKEYRNNMTEEQIQKERLRSIVRGHKRRKVTGNHLSIKIIRELLEQYKYKCYYCNSKIIHTERNSYHIDHYVPIAKGGTAEISNLVISCPTCNMSKGAKMPHEFMLKLGKLF